MTNFRKNIAFCGAALLMWTTSAHSDGLDDAKREMSLHENSVRSSRTSVEQTSAKLKKLAAQIQELKKGPKGQTSFFGKYKLESLLKDAQLVSETLRTQESQLARNEAAYHQSQGKLLLELDRHIESSRRAMGEKSLPREDRAAAALRLDELLTERLRIASTPHRSVDTTVTTHVTTGEYSEEMLTAVEDIATRMRKDVTALESELRDARRQRFIRNELSHLLEEEAFFGEQGFVRGGASRAQNTAANLATTQAKPGEPTASGTPGIAEPGVQPSGTEGSGAQPVEGDGAGTDTSGSDVPSENIPEASPEVIDVVQPRLDTRDSMPETNIHNERDPIAQNASEYGLKSSEIQSSSSRASIDSLQSHIRWLEQRLIQSRKLLQQVESVAKDIKSSTER